MAIGVGTTVIVSGASQGLGKQMADDVHALGANVVLLARSGAKLEAIAAKHNKAARSGQWTKYYAIDLARASAYDGFMEWVTQEGVLPDVVVCCAGSSKPMLFDSLSLADIEQGIDVNYKTCAFLLHTLMPLLKTRDDRKRHVVIVSSAVAFYQFIGYAQYAPMKMALRGLGDALSHELNPFGVHVHTVFPGNFDSEGYKEENLTKPSITAEIEGGSVAISVEQCSRHVLACLGFSPSSWRHFLWPNGQRYVFTDILGWIMYTFAMGFSPRDFYGLEILVGLVGLVIARFVDMFHEHLIKRWFAKKQL